MPALPSGFHRESKPQPTGADPELPKTKEPHDGFKDRRSRENHVRSIGGETGHRFALGQREAPEMLDVPVKPFGTQARSFQPLAIKTAQPPLDTSQDARCPAQSDKLN